MKIALIAFAALVAVGCSSTPPSDLDAKLGQEQGVATRQQLSNQEENMIEGDKNLTDAQRQQFLTLKQTVTNKLNGLGEQSLKLRSLLVKEILSPAYDSNEVELIKKRLRKLEDQRLSVMFDGVDQANSILGHQATGHARALRALLEERTDREKE